MVSLSPSKEYCRNPRSTSTLNLVCSIILNPIKFLPHCPEQQLGTFFIDVMTLSTERFQKSPLSLEILPETKSRLSLSSSFLKLLNSGSAFIMQTASLSLLIISRYLSKTGSVVYRVLKLILSNQGLMKMRPISFSSDLRVLLGVYCTVWDLSSFVFIFSFKGVLRSFDATDCFFMTFLLLGLLPIRGSEELRFNFLSLWELFSFFLDWDLAKGMGVGLFFPLSRLVFGGFFLLCLGFSFSLDR